MSMDIHTNPWDLIQFNHPEAGTTADQEHAKKHLSINGVYRVSATHVHDFHTDVFLDKRLCPFNSVMFDNYRPPESKEKK